MNVVRETVLVLYKYTLRVIGIALALLGSSFLFIPLPGVVLFWIGAVLIAASNRGTKEAKDVHVIAVPAPVEETSHDEPTFRSGYLPGFAPSARV